MKDGDVVKIIRLLRGLSQCGAGMEMDISQQAFAKLEKQSAIANQKLAVVLKALNSSQQEFDAIRKLSPPRKNKLSLRA